GLVFDSFALSQGTYEPTTGTWTVGTVNTSFAQTLRLVATVNSPNPVTNTAQITHSDQFDPDGSNNEASVTATPQRADLFVTKFVNDPTPNVGETITFFATVANAGPSAASGVVVSDLLPSGLTLVTATPSQGGYTSGTGVWTVGSLAVGDAATLEI